MTIEPHISRYIDVAIERQRKIFDKHVNHYMTVQREIWQDDIKKVIEIVKDKPSREEVREIVHEEMQLELQPIRTEMRMYKEELIDHRSRIERLEHSAIA
jgi:TRAP-type C4-dicarboxylate transport system substrate-binding protein